MAAIVLPARPSSMVLRQSTGLCDAVYKLSQYSSSWLSVISHMKIDLANSADSSHRESVPLDGLGRQFPPSARRSLRTQRHVADSFCKLADSYRKVCHDVGKSYTRLRSDWYSGSYLKISNDLGLPPLPKSCADDQWLRCRVFFMSVSWGFRCRLDSQIGAVCQSSQLQTVTG
jgi:hypothetical protein